MGVANNALHSPTIDIFSERRRLVQAVATAVIRRQCQQQAVAQRSGAAVRRISGSQKTTRGRPLCHPPRLPTAREAMSRVPATTVVKTALAAARSAALTRGRTAIATTVGPSYRF